MYITFHDMGKFIFNLFRRKGKEEKVEYPCRKCFYYGACGDGGRTKPCPDRITKKQAKEAGIMRY